MTDQAAQPATLSPPADPAGQPAPAAAGGKARLQPFALRQLVAQYLVDHPGECGISEVAKALGGRSTGAVANALNALVTQGKATRASTLPARFAANGATPAVAYPGGDGGATAIGKPTTATAAAPKEKEPPPPKGTARRPSGELYRMRTLAGQPDVEVLRTLRTAKVPALLYGPPGTGKTALVEAAFPDLLTVAGDGDTQVSDFVGEYTQNADGTYTFVYGPLVRAMREGRVLFIDDCTLISPGVLAVVYPAMDGRGEIQVKSHKGEAMTGQPGFYVCGGHNPGVHGAVLTEALASRFSAQIQVTADYALARTLGVSAKAVKVAENLDTQRQSGEVGWAPQLRELLAFQRIADALGEDFAVGNLLGIAPPEDLKAVTEAVSKVYGTKVDPLSLGGQV